MRLTALWLLGILVSPLAAATPLTLYLNWFPSVQFAGILTAYEKGIYKKYGIDLKLAFDARHVIESVSSGAANIGMASGHEVIQAVARGAKVKAFAAHYQLNPHTVITMADSSIKKLSDLKGKTVGVLSEHELPIYRVVLADVGLKPEDVRFNYFKSTEEKEVIRRLRKGEVDAVMAWEFHWPVIFGLLGARVRQFPSYKHGFYFYGSVFFAKNEALQKDPMLFSAFVKATAEGWKVVYQDPKSSTARLVTRWFPKKHYINGSKALTETEQNLELKLNKRFLFEGVTPENYGKMTELCWKRGLDVARANKLIVESSESSRRLRPEDLFVNLPEATTSNQVAE